MASLLNSDDHLIQHIKVQAKFKEKPTITASDPVIREIEQQFVTTFNRICRQTKPIGATLAQSAQESQKESIAHQKSIFTGRLYNGIQKRHVGGSPYSAFYDVGTPIRDRYIQALIGGRKAVKAKPGGVLSIRLTPHNVIFRKSAKAAKEKDYMPRADSNFTPRINGVVERYLNEAFG